MNDEEKPQFDDEDELEGKFLSLNDFRLGELQFSRYYVLNFFSQDIGIGIHGQVKTRKALKRRKSMKAKRRAMSLTVKILISL